MKEKKKHNNRLFYLLLLLFMTTISLSISSYAWFSSNRLVRLDLLNVNVRAQGSLEISTNGRDFKSAISIDDIKGAREDYPNSLNQVPSTLEPVSTVGELEDGKVKMFYGSVINNQTGNFYLSTTRSIETESFDRESDGKFIAFDLFLRTNNSTQLYLTPESNITYLGEESYGIENAIRVLFVEEGNVVTGSPLNTIQNLTTNNRDNVYIWEPNYDTHTPSGVLNALNVYGINTSLKGDRLPYYGVSNLISPNLNIMPSDANSIKHPEYFKNVDVDYYTESGFTENTRVFNLKNGITKYRVYMWIEGQDVDCENDAAVGNISLNLQFSVNPS